MDLLAAMSGFELIPSGLPSSPNVAGEPGERGKMTRSRRTAEYLNAICRVAITAAAPPISEMRDGSEWDATLFSQVEDKF